MPPLGAPLARVVSMTIDSKILVATDFSEPARLALERALQTRQRSNGTLTLLHVHQMPISYPNGYVFTLEITQAIEEAARAQMAKERAFAEGRARELAGGRAVPIEAKVTVGGPAQAIIEEAKQGGYDLIVLATHGRKALSHFFIGSVAERVVRAAPCSVLVVR